MRQGITWRPLSWLAGSATMKKNLLIVLMQLSMLTSAWARERLLPVDEAAKVPDFFAFRAQLQNAVARHDVQAVLAVVHPHVMMGFGSDQGMAAFVARWQPHEPKTQLWDTMSTVLALGGAFNPDGSFYAPYTNSRWPLPDAIGYLAALDSNVPVYAAPHKRSSTVGKLNFEIVAWVDNADTPRIPVGWTAIQWRAGKTAYVESRRVRSPVDYGITFRKIDGRWTITNFYAGD